MEKKLPEGWAWKRLGDVAELIMGQSPPGHTYSEIDQGMPFLQGKSEFGDVSPEHVKYTTKPLKIASNGSVLMSVRAPVGDVNIADIDYCIGRGLASLSLYEGENAFLFYVLNYFKNKIEKEGTGSTFKAITKSKLQEFKIPLPPLETQRKIVAILEKADETKRLRMQADELTSQLLQSVFLEMFGDPVKNPKGWETEKLGVNCSFITSGSRGWAKFYSSEGAKFIRVQNLTSHRLSFDDIAFVSPPDTAEAKRTKVKPDDLLISITGVVGLVAVAPDDIGDAYVSQHVAIVRLQERTDPSFLASFLAHPTGGQFQIMNRQYGQTKPGIGLDDIRSIRIFIPPISLQQKFVQVVEKIEAMQQTQKQSQQEIDNLFNALMQKAFKGELVA